jgi:L-fuconolactonase
VGVRHIVQDEPDDRFLMREDFRRGLALLGDLSYDILVYPKQLPATLELVERFPEQRLVLDHIAKPSIARGELEPWASQIRKLAEAQNVFCKVSGMVTEADWKGWKQDDFAPYLDVVFEAFGPSRIMVGSDWPVCTLAASYDQVMDIIANYIESLSESDQAAVLGGTAEKFYKLEASKNAH